MANVLVIQPGFPFEAPYYVRGLKRTGATVLGVGDMPRSSLPQVAKEGLDAYLQVRDLWNPRSLVAALRAWDVPLKLHRVECLWEATMELSAEVRRAFRLPGLGPQETRLFRDKWAMRTALESALDPTEAAELGIRNPRFAKAATVDGVLEASETVGFPLVAKPAAGAGSAKTYRVESRQELERVLPAFHHVEEVVLEEFVEGNEYTFDTLCATGEILFDSILRYTPTMLESRTEEWISPQNMVLRDLDRPLYRRARQLGRRVLRALGSPTGITHMEWFETPAGEVVFGEIAARPPGGFTGELMNYACDFDVYDAWAETVLRGRISHPVERKYNAGIVFKRAIGQGRIRHVEGVDELYRRFGPHIVRHDLLPVGAPRRDWRNTLLSDGFVIFRHPDLDSATEISRWIADNVRLYAG